MKRLSISVLAVLMAFLTAFIPNARVFADQAQSPDYISEVKVFLGDYSAAAAEGYTLLTDGTNPVDLNRNAGGGFGSKGEKAVYLGYRITKDRSDAITDLALMNMKGGYDVAEYDALMEKQLKSQIIPFVDNFLSAIKEYRYNYNSENELNRERARFVHDALNKLTDDDCKGKGLGDLLLNETKYEMGDARYNALSEAEKKDHADIVTIIAQSNGNATLIMENLITRAADTNEDNWMDRFSKITYDALVESTGLAPTDAEKELAKLYDDDAQTILEMWDAFQKQLENYEQAVKILKSAVGTDLSAEDETVQNFDLEKAQEADIDKFAEAGVKINYTAEQLANASMDVFCKEYLESIPYGDGTLLDFFMQPEEDVRDDITVLYPLAASLTEGQLAGLQFITLEELVVFASTDEDGYLQAKMDEMKPNSIYLGVDRGIYEKGGVALTSDARRSGVVQEQAEEQSIALHVWTGVAAGLTLVGASAFVSSWAVKNSAEKAISATNIKLNVLNEQIENFGYKINGQKNKIITLMEEFDRARKYSNQAGIATAERNLKWGFQGLADYGVKYNKLEDEGNALIKYSDRMKARSSMCSKLRVGAAVFTVVMVGVTAFLVYLDYQNMRDYYKVDFTPIPHYMVDEKDIISYNKKGEKVMLKNQSAYYKAVVCNRTESAEFYKILGDCADMNGDVGKQWLALYSVKNELMDPILASSLKVVIENNRIPAGYETGIHMFGTDAAFNLNSSLYDWNSSAPRVYVYFQTDDTTASTAGSNFTAGTLALSGGAGIALGAVVSALAMKTKKKSDKKEAVAE